MCSGSAGMAQRSSAGGGSPAKASATVLMPQNAWLGKYKVSWNIMSYTNDEHTLPQLWQAEISRIENLRPDLVSKCLREFLKTI